MLKKILVIAGIVIVVVALFIGAFFGWMSYQMRDLRPLETARISDAVFVVKGSLGNMYLVKNSNTLIAFDASDNPKKVVAAFSSLSLNPDSVRALFLSHSDADHIGALSIFKNAQIYLSRDEEPLITRKIPRHFLGLSHFNSLSGATYQLLGDNDSVEIGGLIVHAITTPGHTPGSMCYRVGDDLFAGDLCIIKNGKIEKMLKIFTEDMATDSVSISTIAKRFDFKTIYTAHTGFSSDLAVAFSSWR